MEIRVHDIIKVHEFSDIISANPLPIWAKKSILERPYVVVRRVFSPHNLVPIGIRGNERHERYAAFIHKTENLQIIRPEYFTQENLWEHKQESIFYFLFEIKEVMEQEKVEWGLIGSVAFELLTNETFTTDNSDIDIIVRANSLLTRERCKRIIDKMDAIPIEIDVQIEFNKKACSMKEYVYNYDKLILFKTNKGPKLEYVE